MGVTAARTGMQCSHVLAHRRGNPCSSGMVDAGESCSCSHSDGTFFFLISAVGEWGREV